MPDPVNINDYRQKRKQLDVSEDMLSQINAIAGADLSADDVVVFEATALNTRPISKAGTIFDQGIVTRSTLTQMAEALNSGSESVPLHTLHQQGGELPVGRVFNAYVQDELDGNAELRAQFYLPRSESALIEKMNLGILDEVSVCLKSQQLLCSKCGFDYFGEEADFLNLWDRTCSNDHTIGVNGTHAVLQGMDKWMELSLVSRGAAHKAKIHGRAKSLMPKETQDRIAASGVEPQATVLFASPEHPQPKSKEDSMPKDQDPKDQDQTEVFDPQAAFSGLSEQMATLSQAMTTIAERLTASEETETETETNVQANETADEVANLKSEIEELKTMMADMGKPKAPNMADDIPAGGVSAGMVTDAGDGTPGRDLSGFKVRK